MSLADNRSLKLLNICMASGFSSTRYLNQTFLKVYGCNVRDYCGTEKPERKSNLLPSGNRQLYYADDQCRELLKAAAAFPVRL